MLSSKMIFFIFSPRCSFKRNFIKARGWENSRQLCKPLTSSRVCITVSNSTNPSRVYIRLCKNGKRFLLLNYIFWSNLYVCSRQLPYLRKLFLWDIQYFYQYKEQVFALSVWRGFKTKKLDYCRLRTELISSTPVTYFQQFKMQDIGRI